MAFGFQATPGLSQTVSATQETRAYSYGIGRITWTLSRDLPAVFAVPHWTAGARILCAGKKVECEIQVSPRDISVSNEERRKQLESAAKPYLEHATERFSPTGVTRALPTRRFMMPGLPSLSAI
jgi:hypothetical protein